MTPPSPPPPRMAALRGLILVYGAGTMVSQVLILRELLVLAQGQELKLALGLWCWLLWVGLGSLAGGRLAARAAGGLAHLGGLLCLLGVLLPATVLLIRAAPSLAPVPWGPSIPPVTAFLLFLGLLAPFGLVSGYFFPCACRVLADIAPQAAIGRAYYLETMGAALGVCLLQLFLLGRYPGLDISLGTGLLLALSPWVLARPASLTFNTNMHSNGSTGVPPVQAQAEACGYKNIPLITTWYKVAAALGLVILAAACWLAPSLEKLSRSRQWPGRQVLATVDSPYALLTATREAEQVSFFANNVWLFSHPDPLTAEHQVHVGLLSHPQPKRVLLLGGGVAGLGPEILKTPTITQLDYVELDPQLVALAQRLAPGAVGMVGEEKDFGEGGQGPEATYNPSPTTPPRTPYRVNIIYQDARRFLETTPNHYDVILMALPEPRSAQLNRFYTLEFFRLAAQRLAPQGVFSFSLTGGETSLHPLRAAYLAMAYHTLGEVFPEVVAFPGDQVRFCASLSPGVLVADPEQLLGRLAARRLALHYIREYYLLHDLSPWRRAYLQQILRQYPPEVNTDLYPGCYFYDLALGGFQEGLPLQEVLLFFRRIPASVWWIALALGTMLLLVISRGRRGPRYLYQVLVMGLGVMSLEIVVLILYQIRLGSLYRQLGMLIAAFMAGMAAGGAAGARLASRGRGGMGLLAGLQGTLAGLALLLAWWVQQGWSVPWPAGEFITQAGYALFLAMVGGAGGGVFALAAALWARDQAEVSAKGGSLYAADLLGATLGTLGVSLVALPVWGIPPVLYLVAALHAGAGLMILGRK